MSFLNEFGISPDTIELLETMLDNDEKELFNDCIDYVFSSINYLKEIGITLETIEKILIENPNLLLAGDYNLKKAVNKVDCASLVEALNNDIRYIVYLNDFI